jgi:hypothetical protein
MWDNRYEWIARRAYELWEDAGRPNGQDHEHWKQASEDWEARQVLPDARAGSGSTWDEDGQW